tara:strand:+ start:6458 stop:7201 length:744 start_codon:yes stop_codon:yes gene_type:complete
MLLKDKTAVITGCSRGIGFSILENFSSNGANIIACVRKNTDQLQERVQRLADKNKVKIDIVNFDLQFEDDIEKGFTNIKKITNSIDILINNAGINQMSLFQMTSLKTFKNVFEINFFSVVNLTQKILKIMKKNNFSKIINISSNAVSLTDAGRSAYTPSKAALVSLTEVLSKELSNYKINVNAIAPGLVNTDMMKNTPKKVIEEAIKNTPLSKVAQPDDVANTALFLASDKSNHITGETIYVTGGMR